MIERDNNRMADLPKVREINCHAGKMFTTACSGHTGEQVSLPRKRPVKTPRKAVGQTLACHSMHDHSKKGINKRLKSYHVMRR